MDHVFAHLLMTYGAKNMVTEFAACLMVTTKRHRALDLRIEVRGVRMDLVPIEQRILIKTIVNMLYHHRGTHIWCCYGLTCL